MSEAAWEAVSTYLLREHLGGGLPWSGGLLEQDAWTIGCWDLLAGGLAEIREAVASEIDFRTRAGTSKG